MDYTANTARAALKAMQDVVLPALAGPDQRQAAEQARLVADFLAFAADRVELLGRRAALQLRCATATAAELAADPAVGTLAAADELQAALLAAGAADAADGSVAAVTAELHAAVGAVVRAADALAADDRSRIERIVVRGAAPRIASDRSWLAPLGFDPDPRSVPDLDRTLDWGVAVS